MERTQLPPSLAAFLQVYQDVQERMGSTWTRLRVETGQITTRYESTAAYLAQPGQRRILVVLSVQMTLALILGLGAWLGLRRVTRSWEERLRARARFDADAGARAGRALLSASLRFYPWAGACVFVLLLSLFIPNVERLRILFLLVLLVLGTHGTLKQLVENMLRPEMPKHRLLPLQDIQAAYAWVWSRRVLRFVLWMVLLILPGAVYGLSTWTSVFEAVLIAGLLAMAAMVLAQQQDRVRRRLGLVAHEGDAVWKGRAKTATGYLLGKLYLVVIAYMGVVVALALIGVEEAYRYSIRAAGKTLLVLAAAIAAWFAWRGIFRGLFNVSRPLRTRYPDLESQANRYLNHLQAGGCLLILVLTLLAALEGWGLNAFTFLSTHSALVKVLVQVPLIVVGAVLLIQLGKLLIAGFEQEVALRMLAARTTSRGEAEKRVSTLGRIFRSLLYLITITVAAMMVLERLGMDIKPLLAGAGIVSLAVGFGAQNLVKDWISGLFFIMENRLRVGDVAILNGTGGLVEQVNLRTTVLRGLDGTIHVFPNGAINSLSNMTHEFSYYLFNIGVAYKEDTDRVVSVLQSISDEMLEDDDYRDFILEPLEVLGVDAFEDSAVIIKARIKTVPIKQWFVGREMNRRIKKRFDAEGIEIPFPHRSLYIGEASKPMDVALRGAEPEEGEAFRNRVREVMEEAPRESVPQTRRPDSPGA